MKKELPKRKRNRLKHYNYSSSGYYFVTILTKNYHNYFGKTEDTTIILNGSGELAERYWRAIPDYYPEISLDDYIVMPNHIHGIVVIDNRDGWQSKISITDGRHNILSKAIGYFKMSVTKAIRREFDLKQFAWQRSFYEHVIRNEKSLGKIRGYIKSNPLNWKKDKYFK